MIELKGLTKHYPGDSQPALSNISLTVKAGEIFGIIGRSGAGKSTLVRCINLLEQPSEGHVLLDGVDLLSLNATKLRLTRRQIGKVFQHFNLLESRTVFGNVAFPLELAGKSKKQVQHKVSELLALVGLSNFAKQFPSQLSGGQKQRVAIARALAADPKVLICDEATSALDPETTQSILKLLKRINQKLKVTIVMVTHEMEVIKAICNHVAVLDQGQVIEQNTVLNIFSRPQHEVTKALTQSALHITLPASLTKKLKQDQHGRPVVRLTFIGESSKKPIINQLHDKFSVETSILQADLETIQGKLFGVTVVELIGQKGQISNALEFFETQNIQTEVLGYVN